MPDSGPQLRDIHVPTVSAWWPLAPGWWVVLALVVIALVAGALALRHRAARRRRLDAILGEVRHAVERHAVDGDTAAFAATASQLLRRVARTRVPTAVTMSGETWRMTLVALAPKQDVARLIALDAAIYQRRPELDVPATLRDVESWVRSVMNRRRRAHGPA